jgi:uncharacterized membrane protein YkoI
MKFPALALGLAVAAATTIGCNHMSKEKEENEENEVKMTLDQVPAAAREGLQREAGGASITQVDKEDIKGKTGYEVDVMKDGKNWEIIVDENGKLISKKLDEEKHEKGEKEEKEESSKK